MCDIHKMLRGTCGDCPLGAQLISPRMHGASFISSIIFLTWFNDSTLKLKLLV